MAVRRARRCSDHDLDRTCGPLPRASAVVAWFVSFVPFAVVGASLGVLPFMPWALTIWLALLVITITWWFTLRPRSDADWAEGMEVLPRAEITGDMLHVRHFRNFSYLESGEAVPRYEERTYDLAKLLSLDYFLSHWSGPVMAHTLVSFGFDDGQFLCVSVKAHRQRWQSYSPLWGLFRSYQLFFVLGDERDIVRLRTNIRREQVYMYRVRFAPQQLRRLLLDYVRRIETLAVQPAWYNSVASNCTTNLFYHNRARAVVAEAEHFLERVFSPRDVSTRLLGQQFIVSRIASTLGHSRAGRGRRRRRRFLSANSRRL